MNSQIVITVLAVGQKHGKSLLTRRLTPKLLIQRLPLTLLGPQPLALLIRQLEGVCEEGVDPIMASHCC
jgi:hypothetical protein